jgi:hypothetical protein
MRKISRDFFEKKNSAEILRLNFESTSVRLQSAQSQYVQAVQLSCMYLLSIFSGICDSKRSSFC